MSAAADEDSPSLVTARSDRDGQQRSMGITTLAVKVATADTGGGLFVIEQTNHAKGTPRCGSRAAARGRAPA